MEVKEVVLTSRLSGENYYGAEKVARLRTVLGDLGTCALYAYGDSRGDRELPAAANHPFCRTFT